MGNAHEAFGIPEKTLKTANAKNPNFSNRPAAAGPMRLCRLLLGGGLAQSRVLVCCCDTNSLRYILKQKK
jgi:hypothetical protein